MIKFSEFINDEITLAFVGDIMQHPRQLGIEALKNFSYNDCFDEIKHLFSDCDAVIGNLETTFSGFDSIPEERTPVFSAPDSFAKAIKKLGITHVVMCNNHMFDYGMEGHERTKKILVKNNIIPIVGLNTISVKNIPIEILSFSTHFNKFNEEIDTSIFSDYKIPLDENTRIYFPHWGGQYNKTPDDEQTQIKDYLINSGAKIIVGSGPHSVHHCELNETFVAYSLGDFFSAHDKPGSTDVGKIIKLKIKSGHVVSYQEYNTETITSETNSKIVLR